MVLLIHVLSFPYRQFEINLIIASILISCTLVDARDLLPNPCSMLIGAIFFMRGFGGESLAKAKFVANGKRDVESVYFALNGRYLN